MLRTPFFNYVIVIAFLLVSILNCKSKLPFNKEFPEPRLIIVNPLSTIDCNFDNCDTCFACRFAVSGSSDGLTSKENYKIFVLVQQRDSFKVQHPAATLESSGTWTAQAVIGDSINPAYDGQQFNIMAIADRNLVFDTLISIKNPNQFDDNDYPKSPIVGLVVKRASNLKITSPLAEVSSILIPDSSNYIEFFVNGTATGIARNPSYKIFILVHPLPLLSESSGWMIQFPDGNDLKYSFDHQTGKWTASAKLIYDNDNPVLDGDYLRLLAVSTHRSDLINTIAGKAIPDSDLKRELPETQFIYSNEVFLKVKRSSSLRINNEYFLIPSEPDTNEKCSFEIQGESNGLILNSNFKIYVGIGYEQFEADLDASTGKWKAVVKADREYFDGEPIKIHATARLKNTTIDYLKPEILHSIVKRKLVKRIDGIGQGPFRIRMISFREAFVTRQGNGNIITIDLSNNTLGKPINNIGNDLRGIAISLDGLKAYVCDYTADYLRIINTNTKQLESPKVGTHCKDIALAYDNRFALLIKDNSICRFDLNSNETSDAILPSSAADVIFMPLSYKAYVALQDGNILCFDNISQDLLYQNLANLAPERIRAMAITPDGQRICLSLANGKASILNTANSEVMNLIVGGDPYEIAISPDGKLALIANTINIAPNDNKISAIDLSNATPTIIDTIKIENTSALPVDIAITPDGKYAYIVNQRTENVTVVRLDLIK